MHHVKGWFLKPKNSGKVAIKLENWQRFMVGNLFGWKNTRNDYRRYLKAYFEIGRKNAKSTTIAPLGLFGLCADGEIGPEVYTIATSKDQSSIVFNFAKEMAAGSFLSDTINPLRYCLEYESDEGHIGYFRPLAAEAKRLDGLIPHLAIIDEIHEMKNRELWDVIETAISSRAQPLMIGITTAGDDRDGICYELHDYGKKILQGTIDDDTFFCLIYTLDDEDKENYMDEDLWIKANPNIDVSKDREKMRALAKKADIMKGGALANFLRKDLNIWVQHASIWIPSDKFDACNMYKIYEMED